MLTWFTNMSQRIKLYQVTKTCSDIGCTGFKISCRVTKNKNDARQKVESRIEENGSVLKHINSLAKY